MAWWCINLFIVIILLIYSVTCDLLPLCHWFNNWPCQVPSSIKKTQIKILYLFINDWIIFIYLFILWDLYFHWKYHIRFLNLNMFSSYPILWYPESDSKVVATTTLCVCVCVCILFVKSIGARKHWGPL